MGIADLVPWVSWWTLAFITWIYERLLNSIHAIDKKFIRYILKLNISKARHHIDWTFLLTLIFWIILSVFLWAVGLEWLLSSYPNIVFSFFSWLIIASILRFLYKHFSIGKWSRVVLWWLLWRFITTVSGIWFPVSYGWFFFAWVLWSSAMILPWISGSYILLIIGMYEPVLESISWFVNWDMSVLKLLIPLWLWIIVWIILLWRTLKKVYAKHPTQLILYMTGLMAWALPSILPIQALQWSTNWNIFVIRWALWWWAVAFLTLSLLSKKQIHKHLRTVW